MAARKNTFNIETIAQYGDPIPTAKVRETAVVRHNRVNGREQVEIIGRWESADGAKSGDTWLTNNFGRKTPLAIAIDDVDALEDLIAALEAVRENFCPSPRPVAVENDGDKPEVPVVKVNRNGRAMKARAGATKKAPARSKAG